MNNDLPRGQALLEFALALPVLLLLLFGVLEFGRAFSTKIAMENAAREGAHYFIYDKDESNSFQNSKDAVILEASNQGLALEYGDINIFCDDGGGAELSTCDTENTIVVNVSQEFGVAIFNYILDSLPMNSEARMLVP